MIISPTCFLNSILYDHFPELCFNKMHTNTSERIQFRVLVIRFVHYKGYDYTHYVCRCCFNYTLGTHTLKGNPSKETRDSMCNISVINIWFRKHSVVGS